MKLPKKQLSIVIPHMGREEMLAQTLSSITQQDIQLSCIEVIVVTKNQQLNNIISQFGDAIDLRVLHAEAHLTISHQRNIGAALANGEYFAFLDADVFLAPNWINTMLAILKENPDIKLISAIQKNSKDAPKLEQLRTALSNAVIDCEVEFLPGRNLLLHRDAFARSKGFPEHLVTCEDYVFTQRVAQQGKLFYSSASNYIHLGEDKAFWPMAEKEVWRGQSNIASLAGRKIPLSEWPSFFAPPLFTFGLTIALICVIFKAPLLASVSLFGSLFILFVYSLRLRKITQGRPGLGTILKFYIMYFPARTWGTLKGILPNK